MTATETSHDRYQEIEELARSFIETELPLSVSESTNGSIDPGTWQRLCALGFFDSQDTAKAGASDLGLSGLFARAAGRELLPGPWLEHLLAQSLLGTIDSDDASGLALRISRGEVMVSLPVLAQDWSTTVPISVRDTVSSKVTFEMMWHSQHLNGWLLPARQGDTHRLIWVPEAEATIHSLPDTGDLWPSASVTVDQGMQVKVIGQIDDSKVDALSLVTTCLLSAFATGAAERLLEISVAYLQKRVQFGRPIGSFQALKHRAANIYIELEHSKKLADSAMTGVRRGPSTVYAAKIACDGAFQRAAEAAIQFHGGIGFTTETPIYRYLARSLRNRLIPYSGDEVRRRLRAQLVDEYMED